MSIAELKPGVNGADSNSSHVVPSGNDRKLHQIGEVRRGKEFLCVARRGGWT